jgi:hypothetical protein
MSYKKRARAGWCTSKKECKEKIYKERQYEKKEIKQALTEMDAGEDFRYPHYKASPNPEKKLEGRIKSIENNIFCWTRRKESGRYDYWAGDHLNWLKTWLYETKKKLNNMRKK